MKPGASGQPVTEGPALTAPLLQPDARRFPRAQSHPFPPVPQLSEVWIQLLRTPTPSGQPVRTRSPVQPPHAAQAPGSWRRAIPAAGTELAAITAPRRGQELCRQGRRGSGRSIDPDTRHLAPPQRSTQRPAAGRELPCEQPARCPARPERGVRPHRPPRVPAPSPGAASLPPCPALPGHPTFRAGCRPLTARPPSSGAGRGAVRQRGMAAA